MSPPNRPGSEFDDRVALEELERLHRSIEEYRNRRKEAEAEFDDFVKSFRAPVPQPPSPIAAVPGAVSSAAVRVVEPQAQRTDPAALLFPSEPERDFLPAPRSNPRFPEDPQPSPVPAAHAAKARDVPAPMRRAPAGRAIVAGGLGVLAIAGFVLIRSWRAAPDGVDGSRARGAPPSAQTPTSPSRPAAAAPSAAPAAAATAPRAVLTALRRVWVRAVVDGNVEVQRELRASDRVQLRNGRTIVIRTGDAGAVRVAIDGKDQGPLGRDGEVVTRTFTAPAR